MSDVLLERLGIEKPIVQAGMGGGVSGHELAAAVSGAGGLGTIAVNGPTAIVEELAAARSLTDRPLAVNVLLPFARPAWFEAAAQADVVVTFWGTPVRRTPGVWLHQVGSVQEAKEAVGAGADGVIVQGVEAGGHVRGTTPALELLDQVRAALPRGFPLLLAGGIATKADVDRALEAGAQAAVAGTRFLLSEESCAHPVYKERLLAADRTILTDLFGLGWPAAPHRVVPNEATARHLGDAGQVPTSSRLLNRMSAVGARYLPDSLQELLVSRQRPEGRLLTPQTATRDRPSALVRAGPLYAGETVARIDTLLPAAEIVAALSIPLVVRAVTADETADLRRQVLRNGRDVPLPGDESPAHHVGVFADDHLVASGNIRSEAPPWGADSTSWRIRGMATWPEARGQGAGRLVLDALLRHARERGGGLVWCNARTTARSFYERAGFAVRGAEWEEPDIGPHVAMWRVL